MKIVITNNFKRAAKKTHRQQIPLLEEAIEKIKNDPLIGYLKTGDLSNVRVYKFHIYHQLILIAYIFDEPNETITLISFGPHENFYGDLKKQLRGII